MIPTQPILEEDPTIAEFWHSVLDNTCQKIDVPADNLYEAWQLKQLSPEQFQKLAPLGGNRGKIILSKEQLLYLCCYGLLAPTSHNTVPQRFKVDPEKGEIEIWLDRTYVLPSSDKTGRQALISIGCVVAHLEIAARYYGLKSRLSVSFQLSAQRLMPLIPEISPVAFSERYIRVLTLRLERLHDSEITEDIAQTDEESWLEAMLERKVVRAEYDETVKLEAQLGAEMHSLIQSCYPELKLHLITDRTGLHTLGKFQESADRTVFEDAHFTTELGQWLLPNHNTISQRGMRGREFGFDDELAQRMHLGLLKKATLLPDELAALATGSRLTLKSSSAVGILTTPDDSPQSHLLTGQAYEELALFLHQQGYSQAMLAGMVEVTQLNQMLGAFLRTSQKALVVFRIGKPLKAQDKQRHHSARPTLAQILLPATTQLGVKLCSEVGS